MNLEDIVGNPAAASVRRKLRHVYGFAEEIRWQFPSCFGLESVMRFTGFAVSFIACQLTAFAAALPDGVRRVKVLNYPDCFELANGHTRVTLCHHVGNGRGIAQPADSQ